jgi:aspartyl-tRNA(Asn)/glutamyl-tRNA(Gln) amidotransferase subunit A
MHQIRRPAPADIVMEMARIAGFALDDSDEAARIAAGAAAASAALEPFAAWDPSGAEPGDFLQEQQALAPPVAHPATANAAASRATSTTAGVADFTALPLTEIADCIARGLVSSVAVTEACLRVAQQQQLRLNCFLQIDAESALQAAAAADRALAGGAQPGALHGVPLAHKAMFDVAGRVSLRGARIASPPAMEDASTIARLRAAGALSLGQLNMSEFAFGPSGDNRHFGRCRNAIDPDYMAGGSSSGSAAATAAGACFGSLGSDTGGSIRIPAAANGVVGLKPTYGLVPRRGAMKLSPSLDFIGPVTRTVRDCARLLGAIAGFDARDAGSADRPVPNYEALLTRGAQGLRVARVRNYFFDHATADVRAACERGLAVLERAGACCLEVDVSTPEPLAELSRAVLYAEATALHSYWLRTAPELYSPQVRVRASTGLAIPASRYVEALLLRGRLLREFVTTAFRDCDVLLMPTLVIPVPKFSEVDVGAGPALWETMARLVQNTAPFNYLGLPAIAVPAGRTANGLPASIQLVAKPFDEATLLRAADAIYDRGETGSHR